MEIINNDRNQIEVQNLMNASDFLKQVDGYYLTNKNCKIAYIMVDGFRSDIGLNHKGIDQGEQKLNKNQLKRLCKHYKVTVLWNSIEVTENGG